MDRPLSEDVCGFQVDGQETPWSSTEDELEFCHFRLVGGEPFSAFTHCHFTLPQVCDIVGDLWDSAHEDLDLDTEYVQANPELCFSAPEGTK